MLYQYLAVYELYFGCILAASLDASWLYLGCILAVSYFYPGFIPAVPWLYPGCILAVSWLYPGYTLLYPDLFLLYPGSNLALNRLWFAIIWRHFYFCHRKKYVHCNIFLHLIQIITAVFYYICFKKRIFKNNLKTLTTYLTIVACI